VKKVDSLENRVKIAYLGLGSNLGKKKINLEKAKFFLEVKKIKILKSSNIYETESWPNKKFPKYFNLILKIKTKLDPISLYKEIKNVEKMLGRKKAPINHPRVCDIDILDYDGKIISLLHKHEPIKIPHPRLHLRNFVLIPLFELSKNWNHPKLNVNICKLLSNIGMDNLTTIKII